MDRDTNLANLVPITNDRKSTASRYKTSWMDDKLAGWKINQIDRW